MPNTGKMVYALVNPDAKRDLQVQLPTDVTLLEFSDVDILRATLVKTSFSTNAVVVTDDRLTFSQAQGLAEASHRRGKMVKVVGFSYNWNAREAMKSGGYDRAVSIFGLYQSVSYFLGL